MEPLSTQALFRPKQRIEEPLRERDRPLDQKHPFYVFGESGTPRVYITREVLSKMVRYCRSGKPNETIGLLAGTIAHDRLGTYTVIRDIEEAQYSEKRSSPGFVEMTADGASTTRSRLLARNPCHVVAGWWHSHPTFAPRFSQEDLREQRTYGPDQVGIVVSGLEGAGSLFGIYLGPDAMKLVRLCELDGLLGAMAGAVRVRPRPVDYETERVMRVPLIVASDTPPAEPGQLAKPADDPAEKGAPAAEMGTAVTATEEAVDDEPKDSLPAVVVAVAETGAAERIVVTRTRRVLNSRAKWTLVGAAFAAAAFCVWKAVQRLTPDPGAGQVWSALEGLRREVFVPSKPAASGVSAGSPTFPNGPAFEENSEQPKPKVPTKKVGAPLAARLEPDKSKPKPKFKPNSRRRTGRRGGIDPASERRKAKPGGRRKHKRRQLAAEEAPEPARAPETAATTFAPLVDPKLIPEHKGVPGGVPGKDFSGKDPTGGFR